MFTKLFKKIKKTSKTDVERAGVSRAKVERVNVSRAKVEKTEVSTYEPLTINFRDRTTGEMYHVKFGDHETFDKFMGNKNMQLVLG